MTDLSSRSQPFVTALGLVLLTALTLAPLLGEPRPVSFLEPYPSAVADVGSMALVLFLMGLALVVRAQLDRANEPHATANVVLFAFLAAAMTIAHWLEVDRQPRVAEWQRNLYLGLLNHTYEAPHNYRPLPYGFARLIERITRDWTFACVSYRWFFTFWLIWAAHRLARRYLSPARALGTLVPLVLLYPLSVLRYWGQLTDPISHALFVLAFLYVLEDRPLALATALALGVVAKETVVIVVPAYLACYRRQGLKAWLITTALGGACVAAFLATRLPFGWTLGYENVNGAGLMIGPNLGLGTSIYSGSPPLWENYLHVLLFVGVFLPFIAARWRILDARLRTLFLVVTPLLLLSNVCFGWLYESRNYVPLVPLLATMALTPQRTPAQDERCSVHNEGT